MQAVRNILSQHELRTTQSRLEVLGYFMEQDKALSQPEIEEALSGQCDRVTIYRTLSAFLEKGIVHKVLDDAGAAKYALCPHNCEAQAYHHHDHVHFKCQKCGRTLCIQDVSMPQVKLPQGFEIAEADILLQGTCPTCKAKA
jgi:Fur family ferric uptake transcriptional regulator